MGACGVRKSVLELRALGFPREASPPGTLITSQRPPEAVAQRGKLHHDFLEDRCSAHNGDNRVWGGVLGRVGHVEPEGAV